MSKLCHLKQQNSGNKTAKSDTGKSRILTSEDVQGK
jgi:hypothetical protein